MKYLLALILLPFFSCDKEKIQQQVETNALISFLAGKDWKVTTFKRGSTDVTADFAGYKFQFKSDLKVNAVLISNGSIENTGTWNANVGAQTITSTFTNANATITLLNGTWVISKTTMTSVEASQAVGAELRTLRLDQL